MKFRSVLFVGFSYSRGLLSPWFIWNILASVLFCVCLSNLRQGTWQKGVKGGRVLRSPRWKTCSGNDNGGQGVLRISRSFARRDLMHPRYTCAAPWEPVDKPRIMQISRCSMNENHAVSPSLPSSLLPFPALRFSHFYEKERRNCQVHFICVGRISCVRRPLLVFLGNANSRKLLFVLDKYRHEYTAPRTSQLS